MLQMCKESSWFMNLIKHVFVVTMRKQEERKMFQRPKILILVSYNCTHQNHFQSGQMSKDNSSF